MDTSSYLLASAFSFSPFMNAAATCNINGVVTSCPGLGSSFTSLVFLIAFVVMLAGMWKVFVKAGQPGWAAIIPIYNVYILLKIVNKPWWWIFLYLIPIVSLIVACVVTYELAKSFGKGVGFTIGLLFVPFIFFPLLGFGNETYKGASAVNTVPAN